MEGGSLGPLDLGVVQGGIVAIGMDELCMGAAFDDAPVFHTPIERDERVVPPGKKSRRGKGGERETYRIRSASWARW